MTSKAYTVTIHLDVNTVDCPGVWLCPQGKAFLKVCLFGASDLTKSVDPCFPLVIRERFIFEKHFIDMTSVYELHDRIGRSVISMELMQCPVGSAACVKLAIFNTLLSDILHPYSTCFSKPPDTTGIELLFTTCRIFPGVIAPKADIATKVIVSDLHGDGGKPSVRRVPLKMRAGDKKRQQAVCHTMNRLNCECFTRKRAQSTAKETGDNGKNNNKIESEPSATARRLSMTAPPRREDRYFKPVKTSFYEEPSYEQVPHRPNQQGMRKSHLARQPRTEEDPAEYWRLENDGFGMGRDSNLSEANEVQRYREYSGHWVNDASEPRFKSTGLPPSKSKQPTDHGKSNRNGNNGDRAIKHALEDCDKLLKEYETDELIEDDELRRKYLECLSLKGKTRDEETPESSSSEDILQQTVVERPVTNLTVKYPKDPSSERNRKTLTKIPSWSEVVEPEPPKTAPGRSAKEKAPTVSTNKYDLPCHGKCCKCGEQAGQTVVQPPRNPKGNKTQSSRDRDREREIDEERLRYWDRKRVHVRELNKKRYEQEQSAPSSESIDQVQDRGKSPPAQRKDIDQARDRRKSPPAQRKDEGRPKTTNGADGGVLRLSKPIVQQGLDKTKPYPGTKQRDPPRGRISEGKSKKEKAQKEIRTSTASGKPQGDTEGTNSDTAKGRLEQGDSPAEEGCDCDLCEKYQKMYNPTTHPCPRFRKKVNSRPKTPGNRKLISSRKTGPLKYKDALRKADREGDRERQECGFFHCDGPIDTETIAEMNEIQKFYYGR